MGEGSENPIDTYYTPTFIQPSPQPQKTQKPRKPKRKDTQIPQSSDPSDNVADEAFHKELGDSLMRAAITASSLEAEQDSDNITKTRSKATPNESSSQGTTSGGGPRVLDLEKIKTTEHNEIASLKRRVKKLEKKNRIDAIDVDEEITLVSAAVDKVSTASDATTVSAATTTTATITIVDDITLAQALEEMKSTKPKQKGVVIQELAKFDEEEILAREKAKKEKEANIALIETWDDIQAKIDVDHQLAERLQAQEQEELSVKEKATFFSNS
ncbi:hypothetical protein Tco_1569604 [Tanacetum coccineum]